MVPRRLTISCPGCLSEFREISVDEAENILFHGCEDCRSVGRMSPMDEVEVEVDTSKIENGEPEADGPEVQEP